MRGGGGSGLVGDGIPTPAYPLLRISIYYAAFAIPSESDVLRRRCRRQELEPVRRDQVVRAGRAEDLPLARGLDVQVPQGPPEGGLRVHPAHSHTSSGSREPPHRGHGLMRAADCAAASEPMPRESRSPDVGTFSGSRLPWGLVETPLSRPAARLKYDRMRARGSVSSS